MKKDIYKIKRPLTAAQIIILGFLLVILIGTMLLTLPISSGTGEATDFKTSLFTAFNSACVTGLTVVDVGSYWSVFGQTVIIVMVQIGGLGFMSVAVFISILIRRTITPRERIILAQSLGLNSSEGLVRLFKKILAGTFIVEFGGALTLSTQFIPIFGIKEGIRRSVFHSVSAFCNAGFDLMGTYSGEFSGFPLFALIL